MSRIGAGGARWLPLGIGLAVALVAAIGILRLELAPTLGLVAVLYGIAGGVSARQPAPPVAVLKQLITPVAVLFVGFAFNAMSATLLAVPAAALAAAALGRALRGRRP